MMSRAIGRSWLREGTKTSADLPPLMTRCAGLAIALKREAEFGMVKVWWDIVNDWSRSVGRYCIVAKSSTLSHFATSLVSSKEAERPTNRAGDNCVAKRSKDNASS